MTVQEGGYRGAKCKRSEASARPLGQELLRRRISDLVLPGYQGNDDGRCVVRHESFSCSPLLSHSFP